MIKVSSNAKINLCLYVKSKLNNGYHELNSIMMPIGLSDTLTFEIIDDDKIILTSTNKFLPLDNKNIIYRILEYMKNKFQILKGIKVHIEKNIPISAGMAGGSTNGAFSLITFNKLFNLNLNDTELINIAHKFGSDIPFFIKNKTCFLEGTGEILTVVENNFDKQLILINPLFEVSTKTVFQNVQAYTSDCSDDLENIKIALKDNNSELLYKHLKNDLEDVTLKLYPNIKKLKDKVLSLGAEFVMMTGSGPTLFGFVDNYDNAVKLKKELELDKTLWVDIPTRRI